VRRPASQYDQLSTTGSVALQGALGFALVNGFLPAIGRRSRPRQHWLRCVAGTFAGLPKGAPWRWA